jgi:preprotein translocase subunit SecG
MLQSLLITLHLALCVSIVGLVLIQRGKGADAGAGFGAGASGTVFGARGSATFFSKATAVVATLFFVTSLALTYVASQPVEAPKSLVESVPVETPAEPAPAPLNEDEVPVLDTESPALA